MKSLKIIVLAVISFFLIISLYFVFNTHKSGDKIEKYNNSANLREVIAGVPRHFPPQYSVFPSPYLTNTMEKPVGFAIDVIEEIAKRSGLKVTYKIKNNWTEVIDSLKNNEVDLIPNLGIIEDRINAFDFTNAVETFPIVIFVAKENNQIKGMDNLVNHKVAVIKENIGDNIMKQYPEIKSYLFDEIETAFFELVSGNIDALIYPEPVVLQIARDIKLEDKIKVVGKPLAVVKRAIAVSKNNTELLTKLDKSVKSFVGTKEYRNIYFKWYGQPTPFWSLERILNVLVGFLSVIIIVIFSWYYASSRSFSKLKKLKEKLQKSENLYKAIVEDQTELICRFNADGILTFVNDAYCRYFNVTKEELIGHTFFPLIPEEDKEIVDNHMAILGIKNPILTCEHRVIDPQGNIRWHQWTDRVILDDQGEIVEIQSVGRDITLLKQIEGELIELNTQLENRVKQRTKELEKEIEERKLVEIELINSKNQYKKLVEGLPAIIYTFSDKRGGIYYSPYVSSILGYSVEYLYENPWTWQQLIHPEDLPKVNQIIEKFSQNGSFSIEYRMRDTQGNWHWIYDKSIGKKLENEETIVEGLAIDITEKKELEKELIENKERFQRAIINAPFPIIIHDQDGEIIQINEAWTDITGYTHEDIPMIKDWVEKAYREDKNKVNLGINQLFDLNRKVDEGEFKIYTKTGDIRIWNFSSAPLGTLSNQKKLVISTAVDITQKKEIEDQLRYDAFHDSLTGLYNRSLFKERVEQCLKINKRDPDYLFAVLFIDLDRFKVINDSLGHQIGDGLLMAIARRLETSIRASDTLARLGGDEFTILLEPIKNVKEATIIAERINYELSLPFYLEKKEIITSASIGIAFSSTGYEEWSDILRDADLAMYGAKEKGKARYEIFDPSMHIQISRFLELETDLRLALERQEFVLYYQPIVNLQTHQLDGFEALIRWKHPQHGLLPPMEFIPIAEETGLIIPLGEWILLEACLQMKLWQSMFPQAQNLRMSVNLSGKQLQKQNLIETIDNTLEKIGLNSRNLKLEITESMLIENQQIATNLLTEIKRRDITISLDDFGTGYSSLSYLHRFPIDTLKIDKSFVSRIGEMGENLEIIQAILTLAKTLKMDVIAEGIEVDFHLEKLKSLQCQYGQGYYFAKPLSVLDAQEYIKNHLIAISD
jgi:diguanylate cyclase (GGDEF)-like protein/PAS domain S-box-containing protein